ncbi:hypothetical protein KQI38_09415 [Tissierella carlieri]|nr:hypothetical protein [Tissierella carlieri]MBU5312245.1 hypothetical protein [Tissierella carlieri]
MVNGRKKKSACWQAKTLFSKAVDEYFIPSILTERMSLCKGGNEFG